MKNILLIGVGGTGSEAVDVLYQKIRELGKTVDNYISACVFDTDAGDIDSIRNATKISMTDNASVGTICDRIGKEYIREWFPCDDPTIRAQEMIRGAAQWRKKSYLAFLNAMNKPMLRSKLNSALDNMVSDPSASVEVYVISSVAGGTGSGSFIPIALYVKRYLRRRLGKNPIVNAMIALPDIFAEQQTRDNKIKVYSNAYAILRELNAINIVARNGKNFTESKTSRKKSPIRIVIGNRNEPNVGLLFDSADPQFWTPEAAPFSQIFLLDKIVGVNSVKAHNIVLANALYTLICTEIGAKFDSEASNHELLRSQNNGSNAIYAGISTSHINYPNDVILDYLAHEKTLAASENEWLILHRETERKILENEENEKECGRRYVMKDDAYAKLFLDSFETEENKDTESMITSIVNRDIKDFTPDGKSAIFTIDSYTNKLDEIINSKIKPFEDLSQLVVEKMFTDTRRIDANELHQKAEEYYEIILRYYRESCVDVIRRYARSIADSIIVFDKKRLQEQDKSLSVVSNLLQKNGKYIHPVSAMVQLSKFRLFIAKELAPVNNVESWPEIKRGDVKRVNPSLLSITETNSSSRKSVYGNEGEDRFVNLANGTEMYKNKKSNYLLDAESLVTDIYNIFEQIRLEAVNQLKKIIYTRLAADIDILMAKYRLFFSRFEKEKEDLIEETKEVKKRSCGSRDSEINVYSSEKEKEEIKERVFKESGPATEKEIIETNDICGRGVFESVYASSCAEKNQKEFVENSASYHSLFASMINAYKESLLKSESFKTIGSYNVIEAIINSCGEDADFDTVQDKLHECFSRAEELATPSLRISNNYASDLIEPSKIIVFMMSRDTAKYIKKNAEYLHLSTPADQSSEDRIIESCAEQFIRRYSANDNVRVSIVDSMPSKVLYCTGEIMDITPLRIEKFDELGPDNSYYRNYTEALKRFKEYGTEMWNPHISNNLHKRGYLPYMNPEMERICDRKVVKALLYGLQQKKITYEKGMSTSTRYSFRFVKNGVCEQVRTPEGNLVEQRNIAKLVSWMRNEDELVEEWSKTFDLNIEKQLNALTTPISDSDIQILEQQISRSQYIQSMKDKLFDLGDNSISIFEFANRVKTSEESSIDCDDAERIIDVAYSTFMKFCSFRTPQDTYSERFIQVYSQQMAVNVYGAVYKLAEAQSRSTNNQSNIAGLFNSFASWLNSNGAFLGIQDGIGSMDETGKVLFSVPLVYQENNKEKNKEKVEETQNNN